MPDILISESGVLKLLHELKVHKAAGPDQIRPRVLRELSHIIHVAPILTLIYRRSYDTAQVPDDWKKAYVTPVFKKGRRSEAGNYRPISLTCIACKIMEDILVSNIMKHANGTISCTICSMASEERGIVRHSCWNLFMTLHVLCRARVNRCLVYGLFENF